MAVKEGEGMTQRIITSSHAAKIYLLTHVCHLPGIGLPVVVPMEVCVGVRECG